MDHLRLSLYDALASSDLGRVISLRRGDLLARMGSDVDEVGDFIVKSVLPAGVAAIVGCATVGALALLSPGAAVILALCLVLSGIVAPVITARAQRAAQVEGIQARAALSSSLVTLIDGYDELAINGLINRARSEFERSEDHIESSRQGAARASAWAQFIDRASMGLAVIGALLVGIPSVQAQILSAVAQLVRSAQAALRIRELIGSDTPTTTASKTAKTPLPKDATRHPHLQASNLAIGWPDGPLLVEDLNLDVVPGRCVAIVGPSGIGKTTLLNTLAGLIPARGGHLTLNGVPLREIPHEESASVIQVTAEDAHIFATSIYENLRVARADLSKEEAQEFLNTVGLKDWCASLPQGVDTVIGAGATGVSGGERRRLLAARALASHAPVMLLDEASEHLDPHSADALMRTIRAHAVDKGLVLVTHRLSALDIADEIILMGYPHDDPRLRPARIIERGTRDELIARSEAFRWALKQEEE